MHYNCICSFIIFLTNCIIFVQKKTKIVQSFALVGWVHMVKGFVFVFVLYFTFFYDLPIAVTALITKSSYVIKCKCVRGQALGLLPGVESDNKWAWQL